MCMGIFVWLLLGLVGASLIAYRWFKDFGELKDFPYFLAVLMVVIGPAGLLSGILIWFLG